MKITQVRGRGIPNSWHCTLMQRQEQEKTDTQADPCDSLWPGSADKSSKVVTGKVGKVIWQLQIMGSAEEFNVTMTTPVQDNWLVSYNNSERVIKIGTRESKRKPRENP